MAKTKDLAKVIWKVWLITIVVVGLMGFIGIGCSDDDDDDETKSSSQESLVGFWKIHSIEEWHDTNGRYETDIMPYVEDETVTIQPYMNIGGNQISEYMEFANVPPEYAMFWRNGVFGCSANTYAYSVNEDTIVREDNSRSTFSISGNRLTINETDDDGKDVILVLEKMTDTSTLDQAVEDCSMFDL